MMQKNLDWFLERLVLVISKDKSVEPNQIRNILTLRYDPSQNSLLPALQWNDFSINTHDPSLEHIEKYIENYISKKVENSDVKRISLALSGGVDSSLI